MRSFVRDREVWWAILDEQVVARRGGATGRWRDVATAEVGLTCLDAGVETAAFADSGGTVYPGRDGGRSWSVLAVDVGNVHCAGVEPDAQAVISTRT